MDIFIGAVFCAKLEARSANISFGIKIGRNKGRGCDQRKTTYIELSAVKQERVDIFLYNKCALWVLD
jgi:hypothetical protein